MTLVQPEKGRARIDDLGGEIRVTIPSRKNIPMLIFIIAWLGGWTVGGIFAAGQLFVSLGDKSKGGPEYFLAFWLLGWLVGEVMVFYSLAKGIAGKENITFTPEKLIINRQPFGFGYPKEYLISEVKNLRIRQDDSFIYKWANPFPGSLNPRISFDYGMKTLGFAQDIDEAEAGYIVKMIKEKNFVRESAGF
ncbi:MAG: hypothetical protein PHE84_09445 [bacterium]|nr:hypothetical protein [bacterium]